MTNDFKDIGLNVVSAIINNTISGVTLSSTGVLLPNFWFIGSFRILLVHSINHINLYSQNEKENITELYIKNQML
nr:MAG TPA: hypothetical protein [Crassvirales sp.]